MTDGAANTIPTAGGDSPVRRTVSHIARLAIELSLGDRLPNIAELREGTGVGTGTVQSALKLLQAEGLIAIETAPSRGTYLVGRDIGGLWRTAQLGQVGIGMPLPTAWEFFGLGTGLQGEFERLGISVSIDYMQGSIDRLAAIESGRVLLTVMSEFAARQVVLAHSGLRIAAVLPAGSYYAENSVVVMGRRPDEAVPRTARIGIDPSSIDHRSLTLAEFPDHELIEVSYAHLPAAIHQGMIDAAVWHRTAHWLSLDDQGLSVFRLLRPESISIARATSPAALVVKQPRSWIDGVVEELSLDRIVAVQAQVVNEVTFPGVG